MRAGEVPPLTPPVLAAPSVEAAPVLPARSLEAWFGSPGLVLAAQGAQDRRSARVQACATETMVFLRLEWSDGMPDESPGAADGVRATFASGVAQDGQPITPDAAHPVVFEARAAVPGETPSPAGSWGKGGWYVELARPRSAASGAVQLTIVEGRGGSWVTPWARLTVGGPSQTRDFKRDEPGKAAAGMSAALAGAGKPPVWVVREHEGGNGRVLVQECADETDARFPLALMDGVSAKDVDLSVRFKALDGFKDRAAGLIWRVKDSGNHYILRANALEKNVVLYKMQDNLRVDLPPIGREADYGVKLEFDPAIWHVLRVVAVGERFQAYLDGRLLFEVVDKTFTEPGGVGLWTKSDSVTAFDDLLAVSLDAPPSVPAPVR